MVSTKSKNLGFFDLKHKIDANKGHKLGRCYVMFGQTISLQQYFLESEFKILTPDNINEAALNLTERLVIEDHNASPIFLNMIVASLLLQQINDIYLFKNLVRDC